MSRKVDNYLCLLCARFLLFMAAVMPLLFLGNLSISLALQGTKPLFSFF